MTFIFDNSNTSKKSAFIGNYIGGSQIIVEASGVKNTRTNFPGSGKGDVVGVSAAGATTSGDNFKQYYEGESLTIKPAAAVYHLPAFSKTPSQLVGGIGLDNDPRQITADTGVTSAASTNTKYWLLQSSFSRLPSVFKTRGGLMGLPQVIYRASAKRTGGGGSLPLEVQIRYPTDKDSYSGKAYITPSGEHVPHGKGRCIYGEGQEYDGDWVDGKKEGKGRWTREDGAIYDGDWKQDRKAGQGTYTYFNGDKHEGGWLNDNKEGRGTYTYHNGEKYEGCWRNGKKEGDFVVTTPKEGVFEVEYENDKQVGKWVKKTS